MAVAIEEAYDREHEFPAVVLFFRDAPWRDRCIWRFDVVAHWPNGRTFADCWPIRVKAGADYEAAREGVRRRAAAIGYCKVTLYHRRPPPTAAKIARIEQYNRQLDRMREEGNRGPRATTKDRINRASVGV